MFGFTEEQIAEFGLTFGLTGFMLFMLFIIWDLAKQVIAWVIDWLK